MSAELYPGDMTISTVQYGWLVRLGAIDHGVPSVEVDLAGIARR